MNAVEIFLLSNALLVITTIHHGSAEGLCVDLLSEVFELGEEHTVANFRMAYKKLSKTTIDNMYKPGEGDSPKTSNMKNRYNGLIFGYMMDLYSGVLFVPIHMEHPEYWCLQKVGDDFRFDSDISSDPNALKHHVKMCKEYTINYLFRYVPEININGIFYTLYKQWTEDIILGQINSNASINTNLTLDSNYTRYYLEHYTLPYFRYFETYVNDIRHVKNNLFKSVEKYCKREGYKYLVGNISGNS